jgi:hypothetical protein
VAQRLPGFSGGVRLRRLQVAGHELVPVAQVGDERLVKELGQVGVGADGVVGAVIGLLHGRAEGGAAATLQRRADAIDPAQEP